MLGPCATEQAADLRLGPATRTCLHTAPPRPPPGRLATSSGWRADTESRSRGHPWLSSVPARACVFKQGCVNDWHDAPAQALSVHLMGAP